MQLPIISKRIKRMFAKATVRTLETSRFGARSSGIPGAGSGAGGMRKVSAGGDGASELAASEVGEGHGGGGGEPSRLSRRSLSDNDYLGGQRKALLGHPRLRRARGRAHQAREQD